MGTCFNRQQIYSGVVGISIGVLISGCAPPNSRDVRDLSARDASAETGMLNSTQVEESKRAPHERAVLGLQRLNAKGEFIGPCGAVLIRPDVILTAAHCFDPSLNKDLAQVRVQTSGDVISATVDGDSARTVVKSIPHGQYKSRQKGENGVIERSYDHDMAIGFLNRPYGPEIAPQPLAQSSDALAAGQELAVYGFGRGVDYGERSASGLKYFGTLQRGTVVLSGENYFDRVLSRPTSKNFLCDGDSGAPAFLIPKNKKSQPMVVAVNSAQMGKQISPYVPTRFCKNAPSVFQPVAPFRVWIDQVLRENGRY